VAPSGYPPARGIPPRGILGSPAVRGHRPYRGRELGESLCDLSLLCSTVGQAVDLYAPIEDKQDEVLHRTTECCPGLMSGEGYKVAALALLSRPLVTISRR
jgi:hypothetical protein